MYQNLVMDYVPYTLEYYLRKLKFKKNDKYISFKIIQNIMRQFL